MRFWKKLLLIAAMLCLLQALSPAGAEANIILQDSTNGTFILSVYKKTSEALYFQGTFTFTEGDAYQVQGAYRINKQELNLVFQGTGIGVVGYDMSRISETRFKGYWWQLFSNDWVKTDSGHGILDVFVDSGPDLPPYEDGSGTGEGP